MRGIHWFSIGLAAGLAAMVFQGKSEVGRHEGGESTAATSTATTFTATTSTATPLSLRDAAQPSPTTLIAANALAVDAAVESANDDDDGKLRIIAFGAHPDDCEIRAGGSAALWSDSGHHVKLVSVTNGDIGHWAMAGGALARRRLSEVQRADRILGAATQVFDIHDGELMPTLENRRTMTRAIRRWRADVVMGHRPNDYHPDHRYTGVLMQDSAFMVSVPFFCPDVKPLDKNPIFLYYNDRFEQPNPFEPDVVISIDAVIERKLDALGIMESQFLEGGALGSSKLSPKDPEKRADRARQVRNNFRRRFARVANQYREGLVEIYGAEQGKKIQYAEAFEVCEYGRQPTRAELLAIFPFAPQPE